jgi:hypothetical protein
MLNDLLAHAPNSLVDSQQRLFKLNQAHNEMMDALQHMGASWGFSSLQCVNNEWVAYISKGDLKRDHECTAPTAYEAVYNLYQFWLKDADNA